MYQYRTTISGFDREKIVTIFCHVSKLWYTEKPPEVEISCSAQKKNWICWKQNTIPTGAKFIKEYIKRTSFLWQTQIQTVENGHNDKMAGIEKKELILILYSYTVHPLIWVFIWFWCPKWFWQSFCHKKIWSVGAILIIIWVCFIFQIAALFYSPICWAKKCDNFKTSNFWLNCVVLGLFLIKITSPLYMP